MNKKLGIALLLLLALVTTTGTFAYWAAGIAGDTQTDGASVTIGAAEEITTTITLNDPAASASGLVPSAYVESGVTVDTATFTYTVNWDADGQEQYTSIGSGFAGNLVVSFSNFSIGTLSGTAVTDMFTISVTSGDGAITEGTPNTVIITVVFANEPADQATYNEVAGNNLTFDVTFAVTPS
jgi:hypothetical protein